MKSFSQQVNEKLLEEFEKRGIKQSWQLAKYPDVKSAFYRLHIFSKPTTKDIKTMMQWLEIKTIELKNVKIKWKM